jgi:hypothetical protein
VQGATTAEGNQGPVKDLKRLLKNKTEALRKAKLRDQEAAQVAAGGAARLQAQLDEAQARENSHESVIQRIAKDAGDIWDAHEQELRDASRVSESELAELQRQHCDDILKTKNAHELELEEAAHQAALTHQQLASARTVEVESQLLRERSALADDARRATMEAQHLAFEQRLLQQADRLAHEEREHRATQKQLDHVQHLHKVQGKKKDALRKKAERAPDIRDRASQKAAERVQVDAHRETEVRLKKTSGLVKNHVRERVADLRMLGVSNDNVNEVVQVVANMLDVRLVDTVSARTAGRCNHEGAIVSELKLAHDLVHADSE